MKVDLTPLLKAGLRKETYKDKKSPGLIDCYGLWLTEEGLSSYERVTNPFANGQLTYPPYPILTSGEGETQYVAGTEFGHAVPQTIGSWSITDYSFVNNESGSAEEISSGSQADEVWHIADFGKNFYAVRPDKTLFFYGSGNYYFTTSARFKSCCEHKGRLILASPYQSRDYRTILTDVIDGYVSSALPGQSISHSVKSSFVYWSSIGGGDIKFVLQNSARSQLNADDYLDILKRNECGFMPLPVDDIYGLAPLGKHVVVYGSNKIYLLTQVSEPYPTFGKEKIADIGVRARWAFCRTSKGHFFVSDDGSLFFLSPDYKVTKLGYKEFIVPEFDYLPRMSYDETNEALYICSSRAGFVFRSGGMTKINQCVTSCQRYTGTLVGVINNLTDTSCLAQTDTIDFNFAGLKTVDWIVLNANYSSTYPLQVSLGYRYKQTENFTYSSYKTVNNEGAAFFGTTAKEFRIKIKSTSYLSITLEGMIAIIEYGDTRYS